MTSAKWIWYPGEFETWLNQRVASSRYQKECLIPPFWRVDTCYSTIKFKKSMNLSEPEIIHVAAQGIYNVELSPGKFALNPERGILVPSGQYELTITVFNSETFPAICVEGNTISSNEPWLSSNGDLNWIQADSWFFSGKDQVPSKYQLKKQPIQPVGMDANGLYDFGREIIGYLQLENIRGSGEIKAIYGESPEEALSVNDAFQIDRINVAGPLPSYQFSNSKAFRFLKIDTKGDIAFSGITVLSEHLNISLRASFDSSDAKLNQIWNTAQYTLYLNMREFFLDGIKRDRWVWCGDSVQSIITNFYSFFDEAINRRTLRLLIGKPPFSCHINHIMDYTFFWVIGLYDHYFYTNDVAFLKGVYYRLKDLLKFCLERRNKDGMMEGLKGDWVFIDWADLDNRGVVSTEQILFTQSLYLASKIAGIVGQVDDERYYYELAEELKAKTFRLFWKEELGGFIHSVKNGEPDNVIVRYPFVFALLFGWLHGHEKVMAEKVLKSDSVQPIKTPYMRFYELEALCCCGDYDTVYKEMGTYWGGMLKEGATTFWEEYNPGLSKEENYAMYGEPFGKSLCHAWGSGPIYLLGRYFLGVRPVKPGYMEYEIKPNLCELSRLEGTVPTPFGNIQVMMNPEKIVIKSCGSSGHLVLEKSCNPIVNGVPYNGNVIAIQENETVTVEGWNAKGDIEKIPQTQETYVRV